MKTERRHELQHNELADWLSHGIEKGKPYGTIIAALVTGAAVLIVAGMFFSSYREKQAASAWDAYYAAIDGQTGPDEEKLRKVAETFAGSAAAEWAKLSEADENLSEGMSLLYINRTASSAHLNNAARAYRELGEKTRNDFIRSRATFGSGQAYEGLGLVDKAKAEYEKVEGVLKDVADIRLKELAQFADTEKFYHWFAKAKLPERLPVSDPLRDREKLFDVDDPLDGPLPRRDPLDSGAAQPPNKSDAGGFPLPSVMDEKRVVPPAAPSDPSPSQEPESKMPDGEPPAKEKESPPKVF